MMKNEARRGHRRIRVALVLILIATVLFVAVFRDSIFAKQPVALRFLCYTNNEGRTRIVLMEISNRTDAAYQWQFHSDAKGVNHLVAVTDLMETNGELRSVGPYSGDNLFGHDARQFGTSDFRAGERFWVEIKHYPNTEGELRREKLSGWFWSHRLYRIAPYVRLGQRINGPALPPDSP